MRVLVAGGAGYIGSHAVRKLLKEDHEVWVIDDLSRGHRAAVEAASQGCRKNAQFTHGNIADREVVFRILKENAIQAVMHFSAFIEVGESVGKPLQYYQNNFSSTLSLLNTMIEADVRKIVFSSTAAVYGNPTSTPIHEDHIRNPINPYGRSKMMVELALEDFAAAYGLGYAVLRYFNVAGADPDGVIGEAHHPETHLIPRILATARGQTESIGIFGTDYPTPDGTCIRDYVHVQDLIQAHHLALKKITPGHGNIYNLGSEKGFSVREVIQTCARVVGKEIRVSENPRRAGDPAVLVASSAKIREELGWERQYPDLETIVRHAWNWHRSFIS